MRSTRATAALERLKRRTEDAGYSMVRNADGLFYLVRASDTGSLEKLSDPMEQDEFVAFLNGLGPQTPRKITKADAAFEKQLTRKS
jgi:translation initiation factor IF-2